MPLCPSLAKMTTATGECAIVPRLTAKEECAIVPRLSKMPTATGKCATVPSLFKIPATGECAAQA